MADETPCFEDLLITVQIAQKAESEPGFQTPEEVRNWIMSGKDLFNPITCEYVFFDPGATEEFGISIIDFDAIQDGNIFEGYSAARTSRINADEFCQHVVLENGWGDISSDRIKIYSGLLAADALWLGDGFRSFPYFGEDSWKCRTDRGDAYLFIPRRGGRWYEPLPTFDVPMLNFVRSNGVRVNKTYEMDIEDERGNLVPHRIPQNVELPEDVRYWAARCLIHVVLNDVLIKNNPITTREYGNEYMLQELKSNKKPRFEGNVYGSQRRS